MVVRFFGSEPHQTVESSLPEPGNADSQNLNELTTDVFSEWTDLGTGPIAGSQELFAVGDALPETVPFLDSGFLSADHCDESISAEPSLGRSSESCFEDFRRSQTLVADAPQHVTKFDTQTALEVASRSIPPHTVEHVWEQGIWGAIFGNKSLLDVYKPFGETLKRPIDTSTTQDPADVTMPSSSRIKTGSATGLSFHDVVRDKPDIPWQEQRDADLQSSVKFWMALVNRWESGCSIVTKTLELGETDRVFMMFAHMFAGRSPVTVKKRGYSVMRLCDHLNGISFLFHVLNGRFMISFVLNN